MSFIAAILILNMDEADAFITFANLLNWPQLADFFCMSEAKVRLAGVEIFGQRQALLAKLQFNLQS